jgi:hypothetical protein
MLRLWKRAFACCFCESSDADPSLKEFTLKERRESTPPSEDQSHAVDHEDVVDFDTMNSTQVETSADADEGKEEEDDDDEKENVNEHDIESQEKEDEDQKEEDEDQKDEEKKKKMYTRLFE